MTLGPELPVDKTKPSTVFTNALENIIHAREKLPEGTPRRVEVTAVSAPNLCVGIVSTCNKKVMFDDEGLLIIRKPGHGIDARSIATSFSKCKVVYQYHVTEDSMFRLRFLTNRSHS